LAGLTHLKLKKPKHYPQKWVVDVQSVGAGEKALVYLGRYLYRGVIQEKDILSVKDGKVTFRYLESKTKQYKTITLTGIQFLWRVLQHVLPKGFRRARSYGFLHPNSKHIIRLVQLILKFNPLKWLPKKKPITDIKCRCCGAAMHIVQTRIKRSVLMTPT